MEILLFAMVIVQVLLQTTAPSITTLAPLVVIFVLIIAAAGLTRGTDIFQLFGIGSLLGITKGGIGGAVGKGLRTGSKGGIKLRTALVKKYNLGKTAKGLQKPATAAATVAGGKTAGSATGAVAGLSKSGNRQVIINAAEVSLAGGVAGAAVAAQSSSNGQVRTALTNSQPVSEKDRQTLGISKWRASRLSRAKERQATASEKAVNAKAKFELATAKYEGSRNPIKVHRLKVAEDAYQKAAAKATLAADRLERQQTLAAKSVLRARGMPTRPNKLEYPPLSESKFAPEKSPEEKREAFKEKWGSELYALRYAPYTISTGASKIASGPKTQYYSTRKEGFVSAYEEDLRNRMGAADAELSKRQARTEGIDNPSSATKRYVKEAQDESGALHKEYDDWREKLQHGGERKKRKPKEE
jgi:hypothetical protein